MDIICSRVLGEAPVKVTEGEVVYGTHVTIGGPD
jgi:hypothetical protein